MMKAFYDALRESIITQAVLTVGIWGVMLFMFATGQTPPDELISGGMLILGFYFGSKVGNAQGIQAMQKYIPKREDDFSFSAVRYPESEDEQTK